MSLMMTQTYPFSFLIGYIIVFIFCLFGAFIKDCYNTFVGIEERVRLIRIFISSTVGSVILFAGSDYILNRVSWKVMFLLCFIGGMVGFEIMGKMQSDKFWKGIMERRAKIFSIMKDFDNILDKLSSITKDDDKTKKDGDGD